MRDREERGQRVLTQIRRMEPFLSNEVERTEGT